MAQDAHITTRPPPRCTRRNTLAGKHGPLRPEQNFTLEAYRPYALLAHGRKRDREAENISLPFPTATQSGPTAKCFMVHNHWPRSVNGMTAWGSPSKEQRWQSYHSPSKSERTPRTTASPGSSARNNYSRENEKRRLPDPEPYTDFRRRAARKSP